MKGDDEGAATLLAVSVLTVLALVAMVAVGLGGAAVAHGRAQGIADVAALVAARDARDVIALSAVAVQVRPCGLARDVARGNGAAVTACRVDSNGAVQVAVAVPTQWGDASAAARAGPRTG